MTDSADTRKLVGLARSIDALFAEPRPGASSAVLMDDDGAVEGGWSSGVASSLPELGGASDEAPLPLREFAEAPADAPTGMASLEADPAPAGEVDSGGGVDDFESTPLDLAVDSYLVGDVARASEIERLAAEMLESREVEPIARSLARLLLAAGEPPDPVIHDLAQSMVSPVVLGRLARRMGAERTEERRQEYFGVCRVLGEDMAVAIRDDLAETTDRFARRVHCDALVAMGEAGRRVIEEMAVDDNRFLVRNAVAILGATGGPRSVELVTSALANPDARVRREALRSLAKLGDAESGMLVVGLLDDPDDDVRIAAAVAAGELRVERAVRPLITGLDAATDPDGVVPLVRALGQIGDPGAVPSLEKHAVRSLFSKPRADVRIAAYRALHAIGTPHARSLVDRAIDDRDAEVKAAVRSMVETP
jgi:hypothetical protein